MGSYAVLSKQKSNLYTLFYVLKSSQYRTIDLYKNPKLKRFMEGPMQYRPLSHKIKGKIYITMLQNYEKVTVPKQLNRNHKYSSGINLVYHWKDSNSFS
jgi:hypothetical protein